jgi:hypothetical protein
METLLKSGFNPNTRVFESGFYPSILHYLLSLKRESTQDDVHIVKLLMEHGVNVNYVSRDGRFATKIIYDKRDHNQYDLQIIELLLNKVVINDKRILMKDSMESDKIDIIKLLLKYNDEMDIDELTKYGLPFLSRRVRKIIFKYLTINKIKKTFLDPLFVACDMGCYYTVERVLDDNFCDVNTLRKTTVCDEPLLRFISRKINFKAMCNIQNEKYIIIAKILVNYGAIIDGFIVNDIIKSYADERKNIIITQLLRYIPKVLMNIIINY